MSPRVDYAVVETQHSRKRCPDAMINLKIYCLIDRLEADNTDEPTQSGWNLCSRRNLALVSQKQR